MGWNVAYTMLESAVISEYDRNTLDETGLRKLMEPYRGSDIDHGGMVGLRSKDGLYCDEIIVKLLRPKVWDNIKHLDSDDRFDAVSDAWYELTRSEFDYW